MTLASETSWNPLCARTAVVVRAFLAGKGERVRDAGTREHLLTCTACRTLYEEAVTAAAHVGRGRRKNEDAAFERAARRAELKRRNPGPEVAEAKRRARSHRLRLLLLPAALILVLTQLNRFGGKVPVETLPIATRVFGEVQAAGRALTAEGDLVTLIRGQRCETGPNGSARLRTGQVTLTLDPGSRLLVENAGRFRLERGSLALEGTCAVTTSLGLLEVADGAGTLALEEARVLASVERGTFTWVDRKGARPLAAGPSRVVVESRELASGP